MPVTNFAFQEKYQYLEGFGNHHQYVSGCGILCGLCSLLSWLTQGKAQKHFLVLIQLLATILKNRHWDC